MLLSLALLGVVPASASDQSKLNIALQHPDRDTDGVVMCGDARSATGVERKGRLPTVGR